jgi:hypothetical protein
MTLTQKAKIIQKLIKEGRLKVDFKTGDVFYRKGDKWNIRVYWLKKGYRCYLIRYNGIKFNISGQRLVWLAAGGKLGKHTDVDHWDRNRQNNGLLNLRPMHKSTNRSKRL